MRRTTTVTLNLKCPVCTRKRPAPNKSLADKHPELAAQWFHEKNGDLTPFDVVPSSGATVWWKCPEGPDHEWRARIIDRTKHRPNCPFCLNRRASVTNNLEVKDPELAAYFASDLNKLSPKEVVSTQHGRKHFWWRRSNGDVFKATIRSARSELTPHAAQTKVE